MWGGGNKVEAYSVTMGFRICENLGHAHTKFGMNSWVGCAANPRFTSFVAFRVFIDMKNYIVFGVRFLFRVVRVEFGAAATIK